jgi:integrase
LSVLPEQWKPFFTTAALTGMRLGELLAMRWKNLNFDMGVYNVRERLYEGQFDTPKSDAGQRAVHLTPNVLESLKAQKIEQAKEKIKRGATYVDMDLIFCTKWGKHMVSAKSLRKVFKEALDTANCEPIRVHDLRHTYVALLIAQNANPKYIQKQMGHSSIQVTFDTYGHLMPDASKGVVKELDEQVFGTHH